MSALQTLKESYGEIADLGRAAAVLSWDQQTYMPPKGAAARGQQLSTLAGVIHERFTSNTFGDLLDKARSESGLSADDKVYLREVEYSRSRSVKLPTSLVKELSAKESECFELWRAAKQAKDYKLFSPAFGQLIALVRRKAECFGFEATPWNALVPDYERGMTAARVAETFKPLKEATVALVDRIRSKSQVNIAFLDQKWSVDKQREFGLRIARDIGYDLEAGRQDIAAHPFCTTFDRDDVRITTRFSETDVFSGLGSTVHECGHAMYEQGFADGDRRSPLAEAPSMGLHESQSRFWEVRIGQSRPFWQHYFPVMKQYFPGQLSGVTAEDMYRGFNKVEPSLIRVDADEVTYNLHIIIRFELEVPILAGDLKVEDIPAEWNRRYKEYLGVDVPHVGVGCLQDVHWPTGSFGYFPSYTFGNIYGAMLVEKMQQDVPKMWDDVAKGDFGAILGWLRKNVHAEGARLHAPDLVKKVTGKDVTCDALIRYLTTKYGEIYG